MCSPVPTPWCMMSFSRSLTLEPHPPILLLLALDPQRSKHPIIPPGCCFSSLSALMLQTGAARDCTKTSGPIGREKARQDRMWKEAGERRETRSTSHNTICTNPKPSVLWRVEGLSLHQCWRGWLNTRENLRSGILTGLTLLMDISWTLENTEGASGALNLHFL